MAVPDYQALMLPLLRRLGQESSPKAVRSFVDSVADEFQLLAKDRAQRIPSGGENLLLNRLAWARTYLGKAGLLVSPRHGLVQISDRGRKALAASPAAVNVEYLRQFPEFKEWMARSSTENRPTPSKGKGELAVIPQEAEDQTPRERIDNAKQELESALQEDLLQRIRSMAPSDFEELILRLLLAMRYGQGIEEMAKALGGGGDGGVDGVIHQDPLGLERVYIQAKRWKEGNSVGSNEIRDFVGALNIKKANKGVFVTASQFTESAIQAASNANVQVVLINGLRLTELMLQYKVGVLVRDTIEIKALDEGFFEE